jgi:hypothetical protein
LSLSATRKSRTIPEPGPLDFQNEIVAGHKTRSFPKVFGLS